MGFLFGVVKFSGLPNFIKFWILVNYNPEKKSTATKDNVYYNKCHGDSLG